MSPAERTGRGEVERDPERRVGSDRESESYRKERMRKGWCHGASVSITLVPWGAMEPSVGFWART